MKLEKVTITGKNSSFFTMKELIKILVAMILFFAVIVVGGLVYYSNSLKGTGSNEKIEFVVDNNATFSTLGAALEKQGLIKSELTYKIYIKLSNPGNLKAGTYELDAAMGVEKIVETLEKGNSYNPNIVTVTFKEGLNMRGIANIIAENTNNTYDSVLEQIKDEMYLSELINNYWFITEDIKNKNIYYSLEGYLFPDTYQIDKTWNVKNIFKTMLDRMEKELNNYKDSINNSNYSIHQILTLASIIEKEGKTKDFKNISSVFYNRLKINMRLESCATTYYGMGLDFNEVGIATNEMTSNKNPYNTYKINHLPIGPISSPGESAIEAAINPTESNYFYFLSDNEGVSYFFNTYSEHQRKQRELINQGKWYR